MIPVETETGWQSCPSCAKRLQIRIWPAVRQNTNAATALSDQATCFFHPDKAFQACCQRCGRFVCALCDLQLGAEHVCPTCFERGRGDSGAEAGKAEWRYRDVLYDSIAVTVGWGWILFWPVIVAAIPGRDFLAREVSEGAAIVLNSAVRVAFLGGVCGARLASALDRQLVFHTLDGGEALIEECIPQNIARWQPNRRHKVVFER